MQWWNKKSTTTRRGEKIATFEIWFTVLDEKLLNLSALFFCHSSRALFLFSLSLILKKRLWARVIYMFRHKTIYSFMLSGFQSLKIQISIKDSSKINNLIKKKMLFPKTWVFIHKLINNLADRGWWTVDFSLRRGNVGKSTEALKVEKLKLDSELTPYKM